MKRTLQTGIFASVAMLVLILDTKTAVAGAKDGITLCITTVIPSLLPFFILSLLLNGSLTGIRSGILHPIEKLCRMSSGTGVLLLTGLLGGYPSGAQGVAEAYRRGQVSKENARRLLGFCSNAGPAFIFGILSGQFSSPAMSWLLWSIHICACTAVGALLPGDFRSEEVRLPKQEVTLIGAAERSARNMMKVCVWITVFRVITAFLDRWFLWMLDPCAQVLVSGLLELTIGCTSLSWISCEGLRFVICTVLLGFGGICVAMQTSAVVGELGISTYLKGKLLHCFISLFLSLTVQWFLMSGTDRVEISPVICMISAVILVSIPIFLRKKENKYSIIAASGV